MKTGKVKVVTPDGSWSNQAGKTFNRFKVTLADGLMYQFNAVGNFKHAVGDEITFTSETKEFNGVTYNNAKLYSPPPAQGFQRAPQTAGKSDAVQEYIIRQSSVSSAVNFYKGSGVSEDQVLQFAEKIVNFVFKK